MKPRTHNFIALGTAKIIQGTHKCFEKYTGKVRKRRKITPFFITDYFTNNMKDLRRKLQWGEYKEKMNLLNRNKEKQYLGHLKN